MADDKRGREKQSRDEDRRQRERAVATYLERTDEPEPPVHEADIDEIEAELQEVEFPAAAATVVGSVGDREVASLDTTYTVADLLPVSELERFDSPTEVRERIERPTVATAMKRIVEASDPIRNDPIRRSQRDAYETTLRALRAIDADDEDEGIRTLTDWIVERIETRGELPGSRDVRRQAAKFCRAEGYEIRNDEWLGV
jgi:hypothetical protein